MNLWQAIKMAAKSISSNKGRSALTMLGIIIGLAAVMILVTYAQGQNRAMEAYYESQGTNIVNVSAQTWGSGLDVGKELYNYCLGLEDVMGISPQGYIWSDPTIKYGFKTLSRDWGNSMGMMGGGGQDDYPQISLGNDLFGVCNEYKIASGRDLSFLDIENLAQVCVLGSATAEYLFGYANPVDQNITIDGMIFRVIGVYESKAAAIDLGTGDEAYWMAESLKYLDKLILLPSTMTRHFNENQPISDYVVKVKSSDAITEVITTLNGFLTGMVPEENGYFRVSSPDKWQQASNEAAELEQRFLGGIAAISLLVGGIGIMNIMLVTVTERTREIGIRKAIGAERGSIITQFLIEAAMICGIGGIFGIAVGYLGTLVICKVSFGLILWPSPAITAGAFCISVALGILFGMYPAIKASALQPVDALRAD